MKTLKSLPAHKHPRSTVKAQSFRHPRAVDSQGRAYARPARTPQRAAPAPTPLRTATPSPLPSVSSVLSVPSASLLTFRPYQREAFENRTNGLEVWLWGRQTGKSFTLAVWAVDRLLNRPGRLVTILSNSRSF